jgi:hypothetical protein
MGKGAKETPEERLGKEMNSKRFGHYMDNYVPAEYALVDRAKLTPGEKASQQAQATGDVQQAFKNLDRQTKSANAQSGAKLSSGKSKFSLADNAAAKGKGTAVAELAAGLGAEAEADAAQVGLVGQGAGVAANAQMSQAQSASRASRLGIAQAASRQARNLAVIDAAFTIGGAAYQKHKINKEAEEAAKKSKGNVSGDVTEIDWEQFKG